MTKRKRFSEREVLETLLADKSNVITCYRCQGAFENTKDIEREHILEIALGGKDEPANCAYSHATCHAKITNGTKATTAGSSKQRIAKVARLRGETRNGPKKKIPSRPFSASQQPPAQRRQRR